MTPALNIVRPGLMTTVQDLGRAGYQKLGIAVGGGLDPVALRAANAVVGNAPDVGALEVLYFGPVFEVEADSVRLSFVGANATIEILPDVSAKFGIPVQAMRSLVVKRGEVVRVGSLSGGAVLYVGVEGGFDIEPAMGSVSTNIRGGIGGWQARALIAGDRLPLRRVRATDRGECRIEGLHLRSPKRVRVILGPQNDYFDKAEIAKFFEGEYTVSTGSDRVGMRLHGQAVRHARGYDIASDAIAPGSIQVPGNGQPIVLLADRQTTGGYPKIATVISADLPALGRLSIGAKITFEPVTIEVAQALRRDLLADIEALHSHIVPVERSGAEVTPLLHDYNLISGVVDARNWTL